MAFACFPRYLVRCSGNLASSGKSGTDNSEMQTQVIPMIEAMRIVGSLRDLILRRIIGPTAAGPGPFLSEEATRLKVIGRLAGYAYPHDHDGRHPHAP